MIQAYTGYQGSGKSFALTYEAWKRIRKGEIVFTNFAVKGAYRVTYDDLVNFTFPVDCTLIIDESGRYFSARKWKDLPDNVFDLFTLQRHLKMDLLIAVQNFNRIDVALREVIQLVWWARNYRWLPFFVYEGYYDVEHVGLKGEAEKMRYIWRWTRARKSYDTHAMSKTIDKDLIPMTAWDGYVPTEEDLEEDIEDKDGEAETDGSDGTLQGGTESDHVRRKPYTLKRRLRRFKRNMLVWYFSKIS